MRLSHGHCSRAGPGDLQEGAERGIFPAIGEPEEDVGGLLRAAREIPFGAQDEPCVSILGIGLEVGLQLGDVTGEIPRFGEQALDVGGRGEPAGLRQLWASRRRLAASGYFPRIIATCDEMDQGAAFSGSARVACW